MPDLAYFVKAISKFLWEWPLLYALVAVGLYQTYRLRGIQIRYLGHALSLLADPFRKSKERADTPKVKGDISPFQSLMTALAGAIGTGNITGIATAVVLGGFGALFWMWVIAFLGMATAYSEVVLSVKYREENEDGEMAGGPMYTLLHGLKSRKLALCFALFGAIASLGIGCMVQSNSVADAVEELFHIDRLVTGIVLATIVGAVVVGGIKRIGEVAGVLVPTMAILYLFAGLTVVGLNYDQIPDALYLIVSSAFSGQAAVGGFAGAGVLAAIRMGAANGMFANEAGLGSLSIAASSAQTPMPARQGMFAISGVFISTMVICTITGLALAVTHVLGSTDEAGKIISGSPLAMMAFSSVWPHFSYVVFGGLILFAFTTILAWGYYGEKCFEFLFGVHVAHLYRWLYTAVVVIGALLELDVVWALAHMMNALMALPNLYSIVRLSDVVKKETDLYVESLHVRG